MLGSLIPSPLHPAVVHLPIALAVLVPAFALGALWAIRRGARPMRAWGLVTAMFAALSLSSWLAVETGGQAGEQVEKVVAEAPVESHEEAAEQFLALSVIVLAVAAIGLSSGRIGQGSRVLATVGGIVLLGAGYRVGHSGGQLVYRYGAASAYTNASGTRAVAERGGPAAEPNGSTTGNGRAAASGRRAEED